MEYRASLVPLALFVTTLTLPLPVGPPDPRGGPLATRSSSASGPGRVDKGARREHQGAEGHLAAEGHPFSLF